MAGLLAITTVAFAVLAWWERRHHDPVIPIHYLKIPAIARADAVVLCFGATLFSVIVYLPLYLQLGRGLGIGASGLLLLPITLAQATTAAIVGRLVTHTGQVTIFPIIGLTLAAVAFSSLAIAVTSAPTPLILALTVLVGVGLGMVMPPTQVAVQTAAGRGALGVATGSISLCRAVGGAIGVALVGSVLFALVDQSGDGLLHQAMEGGSAFIARMSAGERGALVGLVGEAYRVAFIVMASIAGIGALIATTVPRLNWDDEADPSEEAQ